MSFNYETGSVVWARLGQNWWPGRVTSLNECPADYTKELKKEPFAVVKFFNESGFHEVTREDLICSYICSRKDVYIKKGLKALLADASLKEKFESDVVMAEKLTGGNMDIIKEIKEMKDSHKRRIDYSDLGFGTPKPKKSSTKDQSVQKKGFSNIGEAIQYKRGSSPLVTKVVEYKTKILEQPKQQKSIEEEMRSSGVFKCCVCGYTCSRIDVILWHHKGHMNKVVDYSAGVLLPRKRKRKQKTLRKARDKAEVKSIPEQYKQSNGHVSPLGRSLDASQLLQDWEDEDFGQDNEPTTNNNERITEADISANVVENGDDTMSDHDFGGGDDDDDDDSSGDDYGDYHPCNRGERRPMPKQIDINSAFDALLAESSPLKRNDTSTSNTSTPPTYANNDSDSDGSDWDKYFYQSNNLSDSEAEDSSKNKNGDTNGSTNYVSSQSLNSSNNRKTRRRSSSHNDKYKNKKDNGTDVGRSSPTKTSCHVKRTPSSPGPSTSKRSSSQTDRSTKEANEDHSTHSSNSSTSSGPAYMLVAVDAHGNNVPMPVLNEGGNHLVAVEASMEDGTTRTLYIDPAHLGPNVDLNNLMLHIDNSGQETVIIPTSADGDSAVDESTSQQDSSKDGNKEVNLASPNEDVKDFKQRHNSNDVKTDSNRTFSSTSPSTQGDELESTSISPFSKFSDGKVTECDADQLGEGETALKEPKDREGTGMDDFTSDEELPDLDFQVTNEEMFSPNDIVWVQTHGLWWPSFVLRVYGKKNKASILFINCQQKTPIKVGLGRIKFFSYVDYYDIFESQKDKAVGLTDAMTLASRYKTLKEEMGIDEDPKQFFSRPIEEQKSVVNKQNLKLRGLSCESVISGSHSSESSEIPGKTREKINGNSPVTTSKHSGNVSIIPEDCLSERDKMKLASATRARRRSNERYIRYVQSDECWAYLRMISVGQIHSRRHDYFKSNFCKPNFIKDVAEVHNCGLDFLGQEDTEQTEDVICDLIAKFEDQVTQMDLDPSSRKIYVNTVLFPEAIKQSLRVLTKLSEEDLEEALETGLSETRTERKARMLSF